MDDNFGIGLFYGVGLGLPYLFARLVFMVLRKI